VCFVSLKVSLKNSQDLHVYFFFFVLEQVVDQMKSKI